eukprot:scaffold21808_cov123-Isochrysis_galbana.AAC.7
MASRRGTIGAAPWPVRRGCARGRRGDRSGARWRRRPRRAAPRAESLTGPARSAGWQTTTEPRPGEGPASHSQPAPRAVDKAVLGAHCTGWCRRVDSAGVVRSGCQHHAARLGLSCSRSSLRLCAGAGAGLLLGEGKQQLTRRTAAQSER